MNILAPRLRGCSWLDLFSGSGVMGCEALERGAQRIVAVENNLSVADLCKRNLNSVKESCASNASVEVIRRDCQSWVRQKKGECFDLVYLDPPYQTDLYTPILANLAVGNLISTSSLVICEHGSKQDLNADDAWVTVDRRRYGTTGVLFLSLRERCHHGGTDSMPQQRDP